MINDLSISTVHIGSDRNQRQQNATVASIVITVQSTLAISKMQQWRDQWLVFVGVTVFVIPYTVGTTARRNSAIWRRHESARLCRSPCTSALVFRRRLHRSWRCWRGESCSRFSSFLILRFHLFQFSQIRYRNRDMYKPRYNRSNEYRSALILTRLRSIVRHYMKSMLLQVQRECWRCAELHRPWQ